MLHKANIAFKSDNQNQVLLFPSRLDENIPSMWLSGCQTPDFRTINDFHSKRLKGRIQDLFTNVVRLMCEEGFVSLTTQYIDGTKLEVASNRYTFVWRKSIEKHKPRLEEHIRAVFDLIEQAIAADNIITTEAVISDMSSQELRERPERLTAHLNTPSKPVKKACHELETRLLPKLQEYEEKLAVCGERNSYSKTDPDATFMRMKEDHMKNGQLKPAYNVQISTENQIITHFGIYQRPGDTALLIPYLKSFKERYGLPNLNGHTVIADSGYGSEQNYEYLGQQNIRGYVKYNYFHMEQKRRFRNNMFLAQNLFYKPDADFLVCPMGQQMNFVYKKKNRSELGYESEAAVYQAQNCTVCPLRNKCYQAQGNRRIELNHRLLQYKKKARELLMSEEGFRHRSKRPVEVEAVFGQLKKNKGLYRFRLRGLKKVEVEFGLLAMAHNFMKLMKNRAKTCFRDFMPEIMVYWKRILRKKEKIKKRIQNYTKKERPKILLFGRPHHPPLPNHRIIPSSTSPIQF